MATWKFFVFISVSLRFVVSLKRDVLDRDDIVHKNVDMISVKRDFLHHVSRRAIPNINLCQSQNEKYESKLKSTQGDAFHERHTLHEGDKNPSLSLALADENNLHIVAVTFNGGIFPKTALYLSTDGGKTFVSADEKIHSETVQSGHGLQKHPLENTVFVATSSSDGKSKKLWISTNAGITFEGHTMPFSFTSNFIYHPTNSKYFLALSGHDLWLTTDGGKSWDKIKGDVQNVKWAPASTKDDNTIYASVSVEKDKFGEFLAIFGIDTLSYDNDLEVTNDLGATWDKLHKHIYNFGVQGKFIFGSVFLDKEKMEMGERALEVSTNKGQTWAEVQLPSITAEQFYSILDMSEDMIFIHVDTPGDTGEGTLYTSDSTGIVFSESLTRHLYPNYEDVTDFYKVSSIRGVYITSQLQKDNSVHTMITYDRGGEWRPIRRPTGVPCEDDEGKACYLQIHNLFSQAKGILNMPPLSVENAPGIIMVHGHVAENTKTTEPNIFVSSDGGYSWRLALTGAHHYQILDQGALLVAVPLNHPKSVLFSTDEGLCWHEYNLTNEEFSFTGMVVDKNNAGHTLSIWGNDDKQEWVIHTMDFNAVVDEDCSKGDFELWRPHGDWQPGQKEVEQKYQGCLLGQKEKMYRLKKDAWCLINNKQFLQQDASKEKCTCTKADYECDYGYERVGSSDTCVEDKKFKGPKLDICERGHEMEIITKGYRRIPGDVCDDNSDSYMHQLDSSKTIDLHKVCVEGDRSLLEEQIKDQYLPQEDEPDDGLKNSGHVLLLCVCIALILVGLLLTAYFTRKHIIKKRLGRYRYSQLRTQDYGTDLQSAVATHTSLYDDSSDDENRVGSKNSNGAAAVSLSEPTVANGDVSHYPPINSPQVSSNQPPKVHSTESHNQSTSDSSKTSQPNTVKSYHDDSDVDLLE